MIEYKWNELMEGFQDEIRRFLNALKFKGDLCTDSNVNKHKQILTHELLEMVKTHFQIKEDEN